MLGGPTIIVVEEKGEDLTEMTNALTVDVEEYFQATALNGSAPYDEWGRYESRVVPATEKVLSLLAKHEARATFFVVGWVARRHPELVHAIRREGHEIGCHSYAHQEISKQTPEAFRQDVRLAREVLEDITGEPVRGYRAPTFSITEDTLWALDILIEEGFQFDSSIFPIRHDRYGIPKAKRFPSVISRGNGDRISEFPMSTLKLMGKNVPFSGGGYMRLLPSSLVSWAVEQLNQRGRPAIIYVHPWEFDPDQPRFRTSLTTKFRHYVNLSRTSDKLEKLLAAHKFSPVSEVLECSLLKDSRPASTPSREASSVRPNAGRSHLPRRLVVPDPAKS
jgi:polysaccharide deacetylase family protein (PEP-CTERM system associated)